MTEPLDNPEIWAKLNPMGKIEKELNFRSKKEKRTLKVLRENGTCYLLSEDDIKIIGPFAIIIDGIVNHDRSLEFIGDQTVEVAHPDFLKSLVNQEVEVVWEISKQDYQKSLHHILIFPKNGLCF